MCQRGDESQLLSCFLDLDIARRTTGAERDIGQGKPFGQIGAYGGQRQILVQPVLASNIAHRHDFDNGHIESLLAAPGQHVTQFDIIHAAQRNSIDLDLQASRLCGTQPGKHLRQIAPAGNRAKPVFIQGVERYVDAANPGGEQIIRHLAKLAAIRRYGQFIEIAGFHLGTKCRDQLHDIAAHQRFAASQPYLANASGHESAA